MTTWQELDVDVDGVSIRVRRTGRPTGPPVVLAHGFTDNGACWRSTIEALAPDADVVAVDARHHGRSGSPTDARTDEVDDLIGVVTQLGRAPVRLLGHSMGARTAAELAARRPELVERLVLEDPPWRADGEHTVRAVDDADVRAHLRKLAAMTDAELARLAVDQHGDWPPDEHPDWVAAKREVREDAALLLTSRPWGPLVDGIRCPTLLVCGDPALGAITTPEVAADVERRNPQVRVGTVPGAGHNIRREQRAAFLAAVRPFLLG